MKQLRKTKIVGTIGPASENKLEELFEAGLNVTRVNYSHGSWDEQSEKTENIIRLRKELDIPVALLLDMKGPEIRTGMLYTGKNKKIELKDGQKFTLFNEDIEGNEEGVSVTYKELYKDVQPGTKILIDDGAIELKVDEVSGKDIVCTVVHGNGLGSRKTMNLPGTVIRLPGLAEKDIADLKTACEHDYDFVAISFARNLDDVRQVRKVLDENGGKDIHIITKIENVEGISNLDNILLEADAQMIARGDMMSVDDVTDILAVDLIGTILDDEQIVIATNQGEPLSGKSSQAEEEYMNICKRLLGEEIPFADINRKQGLLRKIGSFFKK